MAEELEQEHQGYIIYVTSRSAESWCYRIVKAGEWGEFEKLPDNFEGYEWGRAEDAFDTARREIDEHLEGLRFEEDEEDRFDEAFELMCRVGHGQH